MKKYNLQRFNIEKENLKRKLSKIEDPELFQTLDSLLKQRTKEYTLDNINDFCKILIQTKKEDDLNKLMAIRDEVRLCIDEEKIEKLKIELVKVVNDKDHINNVPEIIAKLAKEYELSNTRVAHFLTLEQEKRVQQYLNNEGLKI
jgi:hypothetical protein